MSYGIQIGNGHSVTYDDPNEFKVSQLKAERNAKLAETDVYIIEDFPTTKKTEWKAYRKALRDMDFSDPDNLNWPTKPE